jgi:hypothetical protein
MFAAGAVIGAVAPTLVVVVLGRLLMAAGKSDRARSGPWER